MLTLVAELSRSPQKNPRTVHNWERSKGKISPETFTLNRYLRATDLAGIMSTEKAMRKPQNQVKTSNPERRQLGENTPHFRSKVK